MCKCTHDIHRAIERVYGLIQADMGLAEALFKSNSYFT